MIYAYGNCMARLPLALLLVQSVEAHVCKGVAWSSMRGLDGIDIFTLTPPLIESSCILKELS
jgi:hypothetical protein